MPAGAPRPVGPARPQMMPGQQSPVAAPPAVSRRGDAFDPALHPNAPARRIRWDRSSSRRAGSRPGDTADASVGIPPPARINPAGTPATLAPSQTPKDEFDLAYGYVLRRDYALAEEASAPS